MLFRRWRGTPLWARGKAGLGQAFVKGLGNNYPDEDGSSDLPMMMGNSCFVLGNETLVQPLSFGVAAFVERIV